MSAKYREHLTSSSEDPFEVALLATLADWQATGKCSQSDKTLILALAAKIPPNRRVVLLKGFEQDLTAPNKRGGPVFGNVISLINRRPAWTASSLHRALVEQGDPVDKKILSNCINYLVKSGRLTRISRGHYAVAGFGIVTSDELVPQYDIPKGGENEY